MPGWRTRAGTARPCGGRRPGPHRVTAGLLALSVMTCGVWAAEPAPAAPPSAAPAAQGSADAPADFGQQLDRSLALGRQFLLASQQPSGRFRYLVELSTGAVAPQDDPVRQAGALWGLALVHRRQPSPETRAGVLRGLEFFAAHSRRTPDGRRFCCFPGYEQGATGTVALAALALLEFLQTEPAADGRWSTQLGEYLEFLRSLERSDHRFHRAFLHTTGEGWGTPSPYYDGETLLVLARTAVARQDPALQALVLRAAAAADAAYVADAVAQQRDDAETKGFFQWGCLAYALLADSQWPDTDQYGARAIALADWMIDVHQVAVRPRNTAYACEGLVAAWQVAQARGDRAAAEKFRRVIYQLLSRLLSWQVGAEEPTAFLRHQSEIHPSCRGGVLSGPDDPWLRIDTTQHQMHAVLLARRLIWP